jgi:hypothetical protein
MILLLMWEHNCMCQQYVRNPFLRRCKYNMMKFGVGEQFSNAATLRTYHSNEKKNTFVKYINVN